MKRALMWLAAFVLCAGALTVCYRIKRALDTQHHVEIRNATDRPIEGFRLALDNDPFFLDAPPIAAHGSYVFDFVRNRETGYVFSLPTEDARVELGRCGYTDPGLNSYIVTLTSPSKAGFKCVDVSPARSIP